MLVYDEQGNLRNPLQELNEAVEKRNEAIIEALKPTLDTFLAEKKALMSIRRPASVGYRFVKHLYCAFASYGQMSPTDFATIDYDVINCFWQKYLALTAYYNTFFEIVDNKQLFMAYMGITSRQYEELENHQDGDIADLMDTINTAIVGLSFMAGESGNANHQAVKNRLGAKGIGHDMISATEEMAAKALGGERSMAEILGEAKALGLSIPALKE